MTQDSCREALCRVTTSPMSSLIIAAEQAILASLRTLLGCIGNCSISSRQRSFTKEADTWQALALALETGQSPSVPADWLPAPDPHATAHRLVDLHQRRLLAAAQERLAQALFDETTPATDIVTLLEEETLRVQAALRNNDRRPPAVGQCAAAPGPGGRRSASPAAGDHGQRRAGRPHRTGAAR